MGDALIILTELAKRKPALASALEVAYNAIAIFGTHNQVPCKENDLDELIDDILRGRVVTGLPALLRRPFGRTIQARGMGMDEQSLAKEAPKTEEFDDEAED